MAEQDPEVLKILIRQIAEHAELDTVFGKAFGVLGHAELFKPVRNLLHGGLARIVCPTQLRDRGDNWRVNLANTRGQFTAQDGRHSIYQWSHQGPKLQMGRSEKNSVRAPRGRLCR